MNEKNGSLPARFVTTLIVGLMTIQTTIMLAAIPWAMIIHGRLTSVEAKLEGFADFGRLKERVAVLEAQSKATSKEVRQ